MPGYPQFQVMDSLAVSGPGGGVLWQNAGTFTTDGNGATVPLAATGVSGVILTLVVTNMTGTSPTIQGYIDLQDAAGNWLQVASTAVINANGNTTVSVGPGLQVNTLLTANVRARWHVAGTTPSVTAAFSLIGR